MSTTRPALISPSELWLVDFGDPYPSEPAFRRPALVVGPPETFGERFPLVFVAPLTTKPIAHSLRVEIEATERSGVTHTSYVQVEAMRSIAKSRLVHRLGRVDALEMRAVRAVLARILDFDSRAL